VKVGESFYSLVQGAGSVGSDSLLVHHILPGELAGAPSREEVLEEIDVRLRDAVLLVHFAGMDVPFLRRLYRSCGRRWPRPAVVDTAALAGRLSRPPPGDGNLAAIREQLGLPRYRDHHALSDAIATAELFLVLRHKIGALRLRDLTSRW
jgi:DNA polymerase-3 subunit epsilon